MKTLYKDLGFVIAFLILVMIVQSFFGEKASKAFLSIVLLSMLVLNYEKFAQWLGSIFN